MWCKHVSVIVYSFKQERFWSQERNAWWPQLLKPYEQENLLKKDSVQKTRTQYKKHEKLEVNYSTSSKESFEINFINDLIWYYLRFLMLQKRRSKWSCRLFHFAPRNSMPGHRFPTNNLEKNKTAIVLLR